MTDADVMDLVRLAIWTLAVAASPALIAAMAAGTVIAVLQALTQVQEATLTFVPKIAVVLLVLMMSSVLIGSSVKYLAEQCYERISAPRY
ncbi:MAG: flagellar biosynthetic protein FliQ [Proteobacteria bacterium]|nr:flagellar biosynthetic protein FliQ [Pseudomonadota bacterium]